MHRREDADFLVRAVNAFEPMRDALRRLATCPAAWKCGSCDQARAALALAEEDHVRCKGESTMTPICAMCGDSQRLLPTQPGCERYIPDLDFLIGALLDAKATRYEAALREKENP
jgi:hypothetical protein